MDSQENALVNASPVEEEVKNVVNQEAAAPEVVKAETAETPEKPEAPAAAEAPEASAAAETPEVPAAAETPEEPEEPEEKFLLLVVYH